MERSGRGPTSKPSSRRILSWKCRARSSFSSSAARKGATPANLRGSNRRRARKGRESSGERSAGETSSLEAGVVVVGTQQVAAFPYQDDSATEREKQSLMRI